MMRLFPRVTSGAIRLSRPEFPRDVACALESRR